MMKSTDIEKSKKILNEINFLEREIKVMNHATNHHFKNNKDTSRKELNNDFCNS